MKEFLRLENKMILKLRIKPLSPLLIKLGIDEEEVGKSVNRACFITTESSSDVKINIKDGKIEENGDGRVGEFYIPGSTLKGLFRDRFITMFGENKEDRLFGFTNGEDKNASARKSRFFVEDAYLYDENKRKQFYINNNPKILEEIKSKILTTRAITPLDHFSGSVVAPLNNEYLTEDFQTDIIVNNITSKELQGIYFIIRDSINKEIRIGNSKTRGFGLVEFEIDDLKIEVYKKDELVSNMREFFEVCDKESTKIGEKYLMESLHLKEEYKKVDVNNPNKFILALFGEVK